MPKAFAILNSIIVGYLDGAGSVRFHSDFYQTTVIARPKRR
jgi:hypothetical protein